MIIVKEGTDEHRAMRRLPKFTEPLSCGSRVDGCVPEGALPGSRPQLAAR